MEEIFTPEEVAGRLKVNVVTIRRWLRSGKLKGSKLSYKMWRIRASDVTRLLENG